MLVDIRKNTHSTPQTVLIYTQHPPVTRWRKLNLPLCIVLIINIITLKSPLGLAPKNNSTTTFIRFRDLITELQLYAQYSVKMRKSNKIQCSQSLTNTCHLASPYNATAKRTLRGMIQGFNGSEELKIRTMYIVIHPLMNLLLLCLLNLAVHWPSEV